MALGILASLSITPRFVTYATLRMKISNGQYVTVKANQKRKPK